jgi:AcrR family transcriptional regulator
MSDNNGLAEIILDSALTIAEESSWEQLRMHDIAVRLAISLDDIRQHYPQKDDLVEAWFDRADRAMLKRAAAADMLSLPIRKRLYHIITSWLDAMSGHRRVTRDMLLYKLEPGHIHLQVLGIMRISRTVQWFREAAWMDATHLRRILEESVLTGIYLSTFMYWLNDASPDQVATRQFLDRQLGRAESAALRLDAGRGQAGEAAGQANVSAETSVNDTPPDDR